MYSGGRCRRANGSVPRRRRLEPALALLLRPELANRGVAVAVDRQRMRGIEQFLDALQADRGILAVVADAIGARLELADRLLGARRAAEREVVLEEVVVTVDVGDRQDLQTKRVVAHQIREARVGIDHELVRQADDPVVVHGLGLLVALAVAPVGIVRGHAVIGGVPEHLPVIADLELLRIAGEPELLDPLANRGVPVLEILDVPVGHALLRRHPALPHAPAPARSRERKALKLGQMSSLRSISTDWKLSASRRRNRSSMELS